jgi:hypothetical protein
MIIAIAAAPPIDTDELARQLAAQYGLTVHDDPAPRICREFGFQTLYEMPHALQADVRNHLLVEHAQLVEAGRDLLLNYSIFNYLADWMRWFWTETPTERWADVLASATRVVSRYDRIHHVGTGARRKYDGYIWFDARNASQIDRLIRALYTDLNASDRVEFERPR